MSDSTEDKNIALFGYNKALSVALGYFDIMTRIHSDSMRELALNSVRELALIIGTRCEMDERELAVLEIAASFHDIGKIGIPDHILMKPSKLDEAEWEIVKRHSELGEEIMLSSEVDGYPLADVARAIRHHHERFDGSGYPDGLAGEEIPLVSRIIAIAIADSYDAMAVTRSYHAARGHDEIMDIMHRETGSKFEPRLMDIFTDHIEHSPIRAAA